MVAIGWDMWCLGSEREGHGRAIGHGLAVLSCWNRVGVLGGRHGRAEWHGVPVLSCCSWHGKKRARGRNGDVVKGVCG